MAIFVFQGGSLLKLFSEAPSSYLTAEKIDETKGNGEKLGHFNGNSFCVWLFHILLSEGANTVRDDILAHVAVYLKVRQELKWKPKSLMPSTSAVTYWQIENAENPLNGNLP